METGKEVVKISLSNIIPNRFQPRISFDEQELNELADSIKMYGILQPLILRPLGDKYEIIAGERRYKAATIAGLSEVPAILVNLDDQTSAELAIIENIQRKDLTAIEEAKSYKKLLDLGNYTQEQLAVKMGKKQSTIANKLRLLNLLPDAQDALMNNLISERHARSLLQLKDETGKQREVLNRIITDRLTVKDTDDLIKSMMGGSDMNPNFQSFNTPNETFNLNTDNEVNGLNNYNVNNNYLNSSDIPNINTDAFNLGELSNPNLGISATPLTNEQSTLNLNNTQYNTQSEISNFSVPDFDSLLKVEENKTPENLELQPPQPQIETPPSVNKFFPSLEDSPVNMSFNQDSSISSFNLDNTSNNNMNMAINSTRDMIKNLEVNGYKIETEEIDLPDVYQITIKINKNNNKNFPKY